MFPSIYSAMDADAVNGMIRRRDAGLFLSVVFFLFKPIDCQFPKQALKGAWGVGKAYSSIPASGYFN